jgi:TatD DNase family protein
MFDTHTHLTHRAFRSDREAAYDRALETGVNLMVEVGWDLKSSEAAIRFAENHQGVRVAIGFHPHDSKDAPRSYLKTIEQLARHEKVVAVGEIGLDYYRDLSPRDVQRRVFIEQIELAEELNLPVVIHCRNAMDECLPIVEEQGYYRGVFHSVAADFTQATRIADLGLYLGINGTITYNGKRTKSWIGEVPQDLLLAETDCPYLTPVPHRRERNEPAYVKYVCEAAAGILGISTAEFSALTTKNGRELFLA